MFIKKLLFSACIAVLPSLAQSATINLTKGSDWSEFRFDIGTNGGAWLETNDNLGILSFVFSLTEAAYLQVTDAHLSGDVFEVFSNGSSLGLTSPTNVVGNDIGGDYSAALHDGRFSSGTWLLEAGDYEINGFVRNMPQIRGRGAIRITDAPPVPVPGSLALMLSAVAAVGATAARRRNHSARSAT